MAKKQPAKKASVKNVKQSYLTKDVKNAVFVVSVTINLFFFIGWILLRVTTEYDKQVLLFLFGQ